MLADPAAISEIGISRRQKGHPATHPTGQMGTQPACDPDKADRTSGQDKRGWPAQDDSHASPAQTRPGHPAPPAAVANYTSVTQQIPRHCREAAPLALHEAGAIWRIPEPPILFLLVGKRGNAGNGSESALQNADVAQLVEHHLAKVDVASSNLVVRSQDTVTAKVLLNRRLHGGLAERRGSGLQSRIHGFESRTHLGENHGFRCVPDKHGRLAQR
jgi:hypothetical protein